MARIEPVPGEPAAIADLGDERALVLADYHAGIEAALRDERGVSIESQAADRRERVLDLLAQTGVDRLLVLGDIAHSFGGPHGAERGEIEVLVERVTERVPLTLTKGNHDGGIEAILDDRPGVTVVGAEGVRIEDVGVAHGHAWPAADVMAAPTVCIAHEHPQVRLTDRVGGRRIEPVWLRGRLDPAVFEERYPTVRADGSLVVMPAFNNLVGGTWINEADDFLSPFLPEGLAEGEAYLLDGTRLGNYRDV